MCIRRRSLGGRDPVAGCGVEEAELGAVYGKSDKEAGYPADKPVRPADLSATIFTALGIDPNLMIHDPEGRPVPITDHGEPLRELFA